MGFERYRACSYLPATKTKSRHAAKSVTASCELGCLAGRITKLVKSKPASINYDSAQVYYWPIKIGIDSSLSASAPGNPAKAPGTTGGVPKAVDSVRLVMVCGAWANYAARGGHGDGPRGADQGDRYVRHKAGTGIEILDALGSPGHCSHDVRATCALKNQVAHSTVTSLGDKPAMIELGVEPNEAAAMRG